MSIARCSRMLAASLAAAGGLCACGAASPRPRLVLPHRIARLSSRPAGLGDPITGSAVGVAQHVASGAGSAGLTVTVTRIIDPLSDSGASLPAATRAVGIELQIAKTGPGIYDSSATGDVSLLASAGPVATVFAARGVCRTPLRDFDNYITAGEVRTGCVAFAVPAGAKLLAVGFSPDSRPAGRLTWRTGR